MKTKETFSLTYNFLRRNYAFYGAFFSSSMRALGGEKWSGKYQKKCCAQLDISFLIFISSAGALILSFASRSADMAWIKRAHIRDERAQKLSHAKDRGSTATFIRCRLVTFLSTVRFKCVPMCICETVKIDSLGLGPGKSTSWHIVVHRKNNKTTVENCLETMEITSKLDFFWAV